MVQWKSDCDYYLLSYEHFYLPNLPSKIGLKKCFFPQQMECCCGPTATVTSLEVTWNEVPHQALQGSGLAPDTMLHTQRNRPFPKPEKWLIFGYFAKRNPMKIFWKSSILKIAESDIFYVKWRTDEDGAMEKWLWLLFVEVWAFLSPKFALQNGLEKVLFTATIGMLQRANGDCDVTGSYLEWRSWSSTLRKAA